MGQTYPRNGRLEQWSPFWLFPSAGMRVQARPGGAKQARVQADAQSPSNFSDFVYWNSSGRVPGSSSGEGDTGEPARWRSATFGAVSGLADGSLADGAFHVAFKARTGKVKDGAYVNPIDGIYLRKGPGRPPIVTVVRTGMDGTLLDPAAVVPDTGVPIPITAMGIERDGFRGDALAINVSMGSEAAGWAGIYLTSVPRALR